MLPASIVLDEARRTLGTVWRCLSAPFIIVRFPGSGILPRETLAKALPSLKGVKTGKK
jgi:hypothetical protein